MYKIMPKALSLLAATCLIGMSSGGFAQSITISQESALLSDTEVTVDWNYTPGGSVEDFSLEIVSGPPAVLEVTPPNINFGNVVLPGSSAEQVVTISNVGVAGAPDLTVNSITAGPAQFSEGAGSTCPATPFPLAQGASCDFHVVFTPDAEAAFAGSVDVSTSVGDASTTLEGVGTTGPAPNLAIVAGSGAFGTLDASQLPATETFTLENTGDAGSTVTLFTASITGAGFTFGADNCVGFGALGAGDTCTIDVIFDSAADGVFAGNLEVTSDANTVSENLSGERISDSVFADQFEQ